jgi:hypothetical protein
MILDQGVAWNGETYSSLSQVAKAMTGTSWNGHRFFGLRTARSGRTARHCQSKFYTACSRTTAGRSSAVFAHELSPRSAGFDAENRLYLFALTVPKNCHCPAHPAPDLVIAQERVLEFILRPPLRG